MYSFLFLTLSLSGYLGLLIKLIWHVQHTSTFMTTFIASWHTLDHYVLYIRSVYKWPVTLRDEGLIHFPAFDFSSPLWWFEYSFTIVSTLKSGSWSSWRNLTAANPPQEKEGQWYDYKYMKKWSTFYYWLEGSQSQNPRTSKLPLLGPSAKSLSRHCLVV